MLPHDIHLGAKPVEALAFTVQHAVDAVPDIGLENDGGTPSANPHIALQAAAGLGRCADRRRCARDGESSPCVMVSAFRLACVACWQPWFDSAGKDNPKGLIIR